MIKAIVTGHSAGLGAALTAELLGRRISVLGLSRRTVTLQKEAGAEALQQHVLDLSDPGALITWMSGPALARFLADASHALLINNAGMVQPVGPCGAQDAAQIAAAVQLNLGALGPADPCQFPTAVPALLPEGADLIATAFDGKGQLWLQSRNPARLYSTASGLTPIDFPDAEDKSDEGHRLFHTPTPGLIACVSCHAEAGDDGHVWTFDAAPSGPRRTQSLRGGILATAPFHWDGDMKDLSLLMATVFSGRMAGPPVSAAQIDSLGRWLDAQPVLPKASPRDPQAVERGRALFQDAAVGCASCHWASGIAGDRIYIQ